MQKQNTEDKKKKRKILLATLIPLGAAAVATAIAVPLALKKDNGEWKQLTYQEFKQDFCTLNKEYSLTTTCLEPSDVEITMQEGTSTTKLTPYEIDEDTRDEELTSFDFRRTRVYVEENGSPLDLYTDWVSWDHILGSTSSTIYKSNQGFKIESVDAEEGLSCTYILNAKGWTTSMSMSGAGQQQTISFKYLNEPHKVTTFNVVCDEEETDKELYCILEDDTEYTFTIKNPTPGIDSFCTMDGGTGNVELINPTISGSGCDWQYDSTYKTLTGSALTSSSDFTITFKVQTGKQPGEAFYEIRLWQNE